MRFTRSLAGGLVLLVAVSLSCDSDDPLQLQNQLASLSFRTIGAIVPTYAVWDMIDDTDMDGLPDDGMVYRWCETQFVSNIPASSVPWNFSLEVILIPANDTARQTLIEGSALNIPFNLAGYDTTPAIRGTVAPKAPVFQFDPALGSDRRFVFSDPRLMSSANRELVDAASNPLHDLDPNPIPGPGVCFQGPPPGDPAVGGNPPPFEILLEKGDTLIVNSRIVEDPPAGFAPTTLPSLLGEFFVDGVSVTPNGDTLSNFNSNTGISFSYTSR